MKRARFVTAARDEFLAEIAYYRQRQARLGERFGLAVEEAVARALAFPLAGSPCVTNTRRVMLRDFPFSVVYRADDNGIVIFAVCHHARRPGYWLERVRHD